jgi:hypothetical protein
VLWRDTFARMCSERGQASVEWIGILLVVAIALAALARFAEHEDHRDLPTMLAHSVTCAARDGCRPGEVVGIRSEKRTESQPPRDEAFSAPPLVPIPSARSRPAVRRASGRSLLEWARRRVGPELLEWARGGVGRDLLRPLRPVLRMQFRDGAGRAWRSAWFACLVYERVRWAILHPESRSHEYEFPPGEALRILNDCISPLDLVRDWPLLTTR